MDGCGPVMVERQAGDPFDGLQVRGLTLASNRVQPGWLFAALPGLKVDGRDFIPEAVARGATAVLSLPGTSVPAGVSLIADDNPRRRFALMAAAFHGHQPDNLVAVTGTNGKTSIADFTRQIWQAEGFRAASIGTLGIVAEGFPNSGGLTTPDPEALQAQLAALANAGVNHAALEASSHGLSQYRLDGIRPKAAAFTNLSRDHLDYHGDMEAYFQAKVRLFSDLLEPGSTAVINRDDPYGRRLVDLCAARGLKVIGYGETGDILAIKRLRPLDDGLELTLVVDGENTIVDLPLIGRFQAFNALAAAGLAMACGLEAQTAIARLMDLKGAPGRMDLMGRTAAGATVFVDYAHTPDALETALTALRPHCLGRLWVVFGAGGDRDRGKRPMMGAAASRLADEVIVTDDNPRSEQAGAIRAAILAEAGRAREIGDRAEAITAAIAGLMPGDVLLIAGKGHETGQIVGDTILPFDDRALARGILAESG
ncbi:MAG: UDP-N-acetylmuramoyl-L-alanyl-D-glutamate--2,6-diaminopimelate ligase, partial [Rhodospirillales bacterium]